MSALWAGTVRPNPGSIMRIIGHRGARFEAPENTIAGFRYALDLDLDGFEFDVHLSRDNELVVIHDDTVDPPRTGAARSPT